MHCRTPAPGCQNERKMSQGQGAVAPLLGQKVFASKDPGDTHTHIPFEQRAKLFCLSEPCFPGFVLPSTMTGVEGLFFFFFHFIYRSILFVLV